MLFRSLAPVAPLSNLGTKISATAVSLGQHAVDSDDSDEEFETIEFFVVPPAKPPFQADKPASFPDDATVAGFWWIGTTDNKKDANMQLSHVTKKDITIPVLTNSAEILPDTKLMKYKPKATVVPLSSAIVLTGAPKKRAKKG